VADFSLRRLRPVLDLGQQLWLDPDACAIRFANAWVLRTNGVRRFFKSPAETLSKPWSTLPA
jgi:hypothetical protein